MATKIEVVRALLSSLLAATFTADELRYMCSSGLITPSVFSNGELVRGYLPQREHGQKLTRALMSRFPLADNIDPILEVWHNLKASTTSVHSQGQIGRDGILDSIADTAFTAIDEVFQAVRFIGIGKLNARKVINSRTSEKLDGADITGNDELSEILPWLTTDTSFTEDTLKFGRLINRDGTSRDPFYVEI